MLPLYYTIRLNSAPPNGPRVRKDDKLMGVVIKGKDIQEFTVVPEGTYEVTLTGQKTTKTKTGKDMLTIKMTIANAEDQELNGQNLFRNFVLEGGSLGYFKAALIAFDCDPEIFDDEDGFDAEETVAELMGKSALVDVVESTYDNKPKSDVKKIYPLEF